MNETLLRLHPDADISAVGRALQGLGVWARTFEDSDRSASVRLSPMSASVPDTVLADIPGVATVSVGSKPHPMLDHWRGKAVQIRPGLQVGPGAPATLFAGPCGVESQAQIRAAARMVSRAGGRLLRGGAYKPRTSPHAFQGHGESALVWLREAADALGLAVVTEALSERHVSHVAEMADLIQVGSRNMQNFALLAAVGATGRPVLLKRGASATLLEWRLAGEHLLVAGASGVIFCERGMSGLGGESELRNTLDLAGAVAMRHSHGLATIADPSHATGRRDLVVPLVRASLAAGLDGVMIEVHPNPADARSDGPQALTQPGLDQVAASFESHADAHEKDTR
ncbi:MAG: 3-deoxy-7-phosphoheptulonate synthase [Myxococcota bacterium]|jgi:3-deoxy-7-phosphoheptulonate synthase